ncbi:hypothetical protein ThrDRAFT_02261 [Frankia casuarinae]|uniref:Uncharacterized protein n=2 Tax=Frankia TaxID=1854 RepID=Q2J922_FRACC|nr:MULTISPECIES: DUF6343 family protein [Frankia]ETA02518.1 hypothetical protein CcI6DRAFT_02109 [Frankia sp. CcI6]KFB04817.1 hypothetical protein ALLO2DRAFT_02336 [Frankia sp. Allo2]ABD12220.1 hypothetical protein Francci3_2862 [Frankia casuarinae]EYT92148.1 hypothetical protein ThrDRAFT_02261 [Frankia casuarinae]KDA43179.1 hypothetical protein BMG523Draft_02053 [Frankia sp. BMG5.23]
MSVTHSLPHQRDRGSALGHRPWWRRAFSCGSSGPGGFPPAHSAFGLRRVLAAFGLVFCGVFAGFFAVRGQTAGAAFLAFLALVAIVDLVVIQQRIRRQTE